MMPNVKGLVSMNIKYILTINPKGDVKLDGGGGVY